MIGRMYTASPRDTEQFHLRLLLLHVRGAMSYLDLRTVGHQVAGTFQEACRLRNLLEDDSEWDNCMAEAAGFQMPSELRQLFATICVFCQPTNPLQLWLDHKSAMMEDFVTNHDAQQAENLALLKIQTLLAVHGSTCTEHRLPVPVAVDDPSLENSEDYVEYHIQGVERLAQLNDDQRNAVDAILCAIDEYTQLQGPTTGRCFFIDGPGGTGWCSLY